MESQNPSACDPCPDGTATAVKYGAVVGYRTVVGHLCHIGGEQANTKVLQRKPGIERLARHCQDGLPIVDTTGAAEFDEVGSEDLLHQREVESRLRSPQILLEAFQRIAIGLARAHLRSARDVLADMLAAGANDAAKRHPQRLEQQPINHLYVGGAADTRSGIACARRSV